MSTYMHTVTDAALRARLPAARLGVFFALASFADNHTGVAWPSQARICERVKLQPRQLREHVDALKAEGWVVTQREGSGGNGRKGVSNQYKLVVPEKYAEKRPSTEALQMTSRRERESRKAATFQHEEF